MSLPDRYRILPFDAPVRVPEFTNGLDPTARVLTPQAVDVSAWFEAFVDRVVAACGKRYLPVMRMSDGEYLFCVGPQMPVPWLPIRARLRETAAYAWTRIRKKSLVAGMRSLYASGTYSRAEMREQRVRYGRLTAEIARDGVLAPHLSYGRVPFQEKFFPAMGQWFARNGIALDMANYAPFYFVYAMLAGSKRRHLLHGRRVLLVTNASAEKRARVEKSLEREGVRSVTWCSISANRSLFDAIDVGPLEGRVDIAFVAAGVGKPNVLSQLKPLSVPCIDVGYMLEVWTNPDVAYARPYCVPDPTT